MWSAFTSDVLNLVQSVRQESAELVEAVARNFTDDVTPEEEYACEDEGLLDGDDRSGNGGRGGSRFLHRYTSLRQQFTSEADRPGEAEARRQRDDLAAALHAKLFAGDEGMSRVYLSFEHNRGKLIRMTTREARRTRASKRRIRNLIRTHGITAPSSCSSSSAVPATTTTTTTQGTIAAGPTATTPPHPHPQQNGESVLNEAAPTSVGGASVHTAPTTKAVVDNAAAAAAHGREGVHIDPNVLSVLPMIRVREDALGELGHIASKEEEEAEEENDDEEDEDEDEAEEQQQEMLFGMEAEEVRRFQRDPDTYLSPLSAEEESWLREGLFAAAAAASQAATPHNNSNNNNNNNNNGVSYEQLVGPFLDSNNLLYCYAAGYYPWGEHLLDEETRQERPGLLQGHGQAPASREEEPAEEKGRMDETESHRLTTSRESSPSTITTPTRRTTIADDVAAELFRFYRKPSLSASDSPSSSSSAPLRHLPLPPSARLVVENARRLLQQRLLDSSALLDRQYDRFVSSSSRTGNPEGGGAAAAPSIPADVFFARYFLRLYILRCRQRDAVVEQRRALVRAAVTRRQEEASCWSAAGLPLPPSLCSGGRRARASSSTPAALRGAAVDYANGEDIDLLEAEEGDDDDDDDDDEMKAAEALNGTGGMEQLVVEAASETLTGLFQGFQHVVGNVIPGMFQIASDEGDEEQEEKAQLPHHHGEGDEDELAIRRRAQAFAQQRASPPRHHSGAVGGEGKPAAVVQASVVRIINNNNNSASATNSTVPSQMANVVEDPIASATAAAAPTTTTTTTTAETVMTSVPLSTEETAESGPVDPTPLKDAVVSKPPSEDNLFADVL